MEISVEKSLSSVSVSPAGSVNSQTAPEFEQVLDEASVGANEIIIDMQKLEYISSAGLRVLLTARKKADENGVKLIIKNVGKSVRDVFEMTGFSAFLGIE